jgi:SAM-dependent methyltransferase
MLTSLRARTIRPEILDTLAPAEALHSLDDLVRLNRRFGGYEALRSLLERAGAARLSHFSVLDVGAASGDMGREIRRLYPSASVTSLDYLECHLKCADQPKVVADAFQLPFQPKSYDFVLSSLFLHHFRDDQIVELLRAFGAIGRRGIMIVDLNRRWLPYWFVPATRWLLRWDGITAHDAPVSVAAAFRPAELEALARRAGLKDVDVRSHGLSFRLTLFATSN